jgi:DsbC/DsbD-like thiol-disulfide interchange protein
MLSRPPVLFAGLTLVNLFLWLAPALALESPWTDTGKANLRLLAAAPSVAGAPLRAGIEIRLAPGWHTYWRYPGDAGVPPRFDWSGSGNLATVEVRWPAPERIQVEGGLQSIGYHDDVILPLRVRAKDPAQPVSLRLKLDIGVCEKICIPAEARLALDIPARPSGSSAALDAADARVPAAAALGKSKNFGVLSVRLERGKNPRALIEVAAPDGKPLDLFAEGPTDDWALPLPNRISSGNGRARFAVSIEGAPAGGSPTPSKLRLTLVAGNEAIEVTAPLD